MVELLYSGIYGFSGIFTSSTRVPEAPPDLNVSKHDTERDVSLFRFREQRNAALRNSRSRSVWAIALGERALWRCHGASLWPSPPIPVTIACPDAALER
jgi:hypothetical protein